jgi:hypothetical protein
LEQTFPCGVVIEPGVQILVHPTWAFDRDQMVESEAYLLDFGSDLFRAMEVCRGEPVWALCGILMDALCQIALDDRREIGVAERALLDAITG